MKLWSLTAAAVAAAVFTFTPIAFAQENAMPHEGYAPTYSAPADNTGGSIPSTSSSSEAPGPATHGSVQNIPPPGSAPTYDEINGPIATNRRERHHITDARLKVRAQASLEQRIDTRNQPIHVNARHGVVTLTGKVDSAAAAEHAKQEVAEVEGVHHVRDELNYPGLHSSMRASGTTTYHHAEGE